MPGPMSALVVDDDREFRESVALLVEREGFTVREADCLATAVLNVMYFVTFRTPKYGVSCGSR